MVDPLSSEQRSRLMSRIKASNTKPEIVVRSLLHRLGYRFRLHRRDLPGRPDIVLPKHKAVIFVNGCFWHGHTCKVGHVPKTREAYWAPKLARTKERDARTYAALTESGWRVLVAWECELADMPSLSARLAQFLERGLLEGHASTAARAGESSATRTVGVTFPKA